MSGRTWRQILARAEHDPVQISDFGDVDFKNEVLESGLEKTSGGPLKKGEFGRRNRSKAPRDRRGEPADVPKGRRGSTLCKFTTYSAGRYDGIPRTCSRLRVKQAKETAILL